MSHQNAAYSLLLILALCSQAAAQITVPDSVDPHTPIVATLASPIPDGAQVQGGWSVTEGQFLPVPGGVHIWAGPGKHTVAFRGMWIKTRPIEINGEVVQVLEGFGFVDEQATVTVGEDPGPDPPDPPTPGGPYQIMLFYDADRLDNLPAAQQAILGSVTFRQQLESAGHTVLEVLDGEAIRRGVPSQYRVWFDAVRGDELPRVALAPIKGGKVLDRDLPANTDDLVAWLDSPDVSQWFARRAR
jgi:hypothetical protein